METTIGEIVARLALAVVCGGVFGWEREAHAKPAGLRTHMMVALGSATFVLVTTGAYAGLELRDNNLDPLRTVQGIVGGIGFLGAGVIIQARGSVRGMTTAATIWVVGAVGVACGLGSYLVAVLTVVFGITILTVVKALEDWVFPSTTPAQAEEPHAMAERGPPFPTPRSRSQRGES